MQKKAKHLVQAYLWLAGLWLSAWALGACGPTGTTFVDEQNDVCVRGDTRRCFCAEGIPGAQRCEVTPKGTDWSSCVCVPPQERATGRPDAADAAASEPTSSQEQPTEEPSTELLVEPTPDAAVPDAAASEEMAAEQPSEQAASEAPPSEQAASEAPPSEQSTKEAPPESSPACQTVCVSPAKFDGFLAVPESGFLSQNVGATAPGGTTLNCEIREFSRLFNPSEGKVDFSLLQTKYYDKIKDPNTQIIIRIMMGGIRAKDVPPDHVMRKMTTNPPYDVATSSQSFKYPNYTDPEFFRWWRALMSALKQWLQADPKRMRHTMGIQVGLGNASEHTTVNGIWTKAPPRLSQIMDVATQRKYLDMARDVWKDTDLHLHFPLNNNDENKYAKQLGMQFQQDCLGNGFHMQTQIPNALKVLSPLPHISWEACYGGNNWPGHSQTGVRDSPQSATTADMTKIYQQALQWNALRYDHSTWPPSSKTLPAVEWFGKRIGVRLRVTRVCYTPQGSGGQAKVTITNDGSASHPRDIFAMLRVDGKNSQKQNIGRIAPQETRTFTFAMPASQGALDFAVLYRRKGTTDRRFEIANQNKQNDLFYHFVPSLQCQ